MDKLEFDTTVCGLKVIIHVGVRIYRKANHKPDDQGVVWERQDEITHKKKKLTGHLTVTALKVGDVESIAVMATYENDIYSGGTTDCYAWLFERNGLISNPVQ